MRINRIFEGSTEIMHLLIAREAVDQHLQVAGEILEGDGDLSTKAKAAVGAGKFYAKWLPAADRRRGHEARLLRRVRRRWPRTCASSSATRASSPARRSTRWAAGRPSSRRSRRSSGRIVDIGAELYAIASAATYANTIKSERPDLAEQAYALADLFCKQARARVDRLFDELWSNNDDANYAARPGRARGPLQVGRGGHRGPVGRRADDRRPARRGRRPRAQHLTRSTSRAGARG